MTIYFSPSKCGFYDTEIHGNQIPLDKVEVPKQIHLQLIEGQSSLKKIVAGENGFPELVDIVFSNEQLAISAREKRNQLLAESDWTQFQDVLSYMPDDKKQEWKLYRQALRDIPSQKNFPIDIVFPEVPV